MIFVFGFTDFFRKCDISDENKCGRTFVKLHDLVPVPELENVNYSDEFSLHFSWSHLAFSTDSKVRLCGFINGKSCQVINLNIPDKPKIVQICCSNKYCHLLTESGEYLLYVIKTGEWKNINQLLASEKQEKNSVDKLLPVSEKHPFVYKISCGDYMTVAATDSGIYSVPLLMSFPQLKVLDISCGKEHALLLSEVGSIFSWGSGSRGQLGHGELETEDQPRELDALCGLKVIAIAAGGWHSCCVTEQGDLYSWGWNCCGQLGFPGEELITGEEKNVRNAAISVLAEPRPVNWPNEQIIVKSVSCGSRHTIALLDDMTIWGCGWNKYGQLINDYLPEKVFVMTKLTVPPDISKDVMKIVCGQWNSAFIT